MKKLCSDDFLCSLFRAHRYYEISLAQITSKAKRWVFSKPSVPSVTIILMNYMRNNGQSCNTAHLFLINFVPDHCWEHPCAICLTFLEEEQRKGCPHPKFCKHRVGETNMKRTKNEVKFNVYYGADLPIYEAS